MAAKENPGARASAVTHSGVEVRTPRTILEPAKPRQGKKEPWHRHWIIRHRADWLRAIMADPRLGGPAKVCAYAISLRLNEHTLRTPRVPLDALAAEAGMSRARVKAGIRELIEKGFIGRRGGGMRPNVYWAINPDSPDGSETSPQTTARDGSETSPQSLYDDKSDGSETSPLSFPCGLESEPREGSETSRVRARKRAACGLDSDLLNSNSSSDRGGGARSRASPAVTVSPQGRETRQYPESSRSLASAYRARSLEEEIPPFDPDCAAVPEEGPRDESYLVTLDGGGVTIETGEKPTTRLHPAQRADVSLTRLYLSLPRDRDELVPL